MKTSELGIQLIEHYESLHDGDLHSIGLQPKMCPAGYWTEGYGSLVLDPMGNKIKGIKNKALAYKYSKIHTVAEALEALARDLAVRESLINGLGLKLNQGEFDALVSFCYNVGYANLSTSTLLRIIRLNAVRNPANINYQFSRWNMGGKKVLAGLVARRKSEALLFTDGVLKFFN